MDLIPDDFDGTKIIKDLIEMCVVENGYKSEAALARALGIVPQKLNRWKRGKSRASSESITLALILLSCPGINDAKSVLRRRGAMLVRYFQH